MPYVIQDWISGQSIELPGPKAIDPNEPTVAWVEGWEDAKHGKDDNPYDQFTIEWHDWNDGHTAGEMDKI